MSNIEDRLWQKVNSKPRRNLSADFTQRTMQRIAERQKTSLFARSASAIRRFDMRFITKPAGIAAGIAVLAVTAGTGYATLRWLQPNTQVIGHVSVLENGNKRFWLHSDACQGQNMDTPVDSYYEIKAGSKVTPEQIRETVESGCEDDLLEELFADVIPKGEKGRPIQFKPGDKQYYFPYAKLKSVGKDYIVVDSGHNGVKHYDVKLPLARNAKMYAKGQPIERNDLVVGKWLTLVISTTALDKPYATEATPTSELEKLSEKGFPRGATVEGAIQRQFNVEQTMDTMGNMGMEWTRLVKDDKSPDGWSQLIPLDGNWDKYNR